MSHTARALRSGRISPARRLLSSAVVMLLLVAGFVGIDNVTVAEPAHAAGPLTGIAAPSAAFPMYPGSTMLAFENENEGYIGAGPQTFYAYTKAGESFQALFFRTTLVTGSTDPSRYVNIVVTSPTGVVSTQGIPGNAPASSQWGFPRGSLPSAEGIWTVTVTAGSTAFAGRVSLRSYSAVFDGAVEKRGRMWTERLHIYQGSNANNDIPIHFMSSLGYVYKADYIGYYGLNSYISADAVGNVAVNGGILDCSTSLYRTVPLVSAIEQPALGKCGGAYRVFWQQPFLDDAPGSIPGSTTRSGASPAKWVNPQVEAPAFDLTNFIGDSATVASGDLIATVDNFFGGVGIDVFDDGGNKIRSFTVNVPEGPLPRNLPLHFDGLDDGGTPIPRDNISTFTVTGLNSGEIHFTLADVERLTRGMAIEVLNGPTSGTQEATRIYWADSDGFDGTPANCHVPDPTVDTVNDGFLSGGYPNGFGTRCWAGTSGTGWGDTRIVDTWAKQGVASSSSITLHDPEADYTLTKSVGTSSAVLPADDVDYTLTITNTSQYDLWDLYDVVDDLAGILDDADFNNDAIVSKSWSGLPEPGFTTFDAAAQTLTYRGNIPAGETVTVAYRVTVREDAASRGDQLLDNSVAGSPNLPPLACAIAGCRETSTPIKDVTLLKTLEGSPSQNVDGSWNLSYLLDVSNHGALTEPYSLSDKFGFGAGITVVAADVIASTGGAPAPSTGWDGATNTEVISTSIAPGISHQYRVTARSEVAAGVVGTSPAACATSGPGGFANTATLSASSTPTLTASDSACASPSRPSLQKDLLASAQNLDGSWTLSYRLLVVNNSANILNYDLADELRFAADTTVTAAEVTDFPSAVSLSVPAWDGSTEMAVAKGVTLLASSGGVPSTHEYTLVVTVEIDGTPDFASSEWQCPPFRSAAKQAFNNIAILFSGADSLTDNACGLPVNPSVAKYISSQPAQQADGSWSLSYEIAVINSEDDPVGGLAYSLEDTLGYPAGVTVNSLVVTNSSGVPVNTGFTGGFSTIGGVAVASSTQILADPAAMVPAATLAGPGRHVFTVTVNANVPTGLDPTALECGAEASGFLNTVVMTAAANGGLDILASSCADITASAGASVLKSVLSSTQADDGSWTLTFGLDVTNSDPSLLANYTLSDALGFGSDVTIDDARITVSPASVTLVSPAWNGGANPIVAAAVPLGAGTTHHYEARVVATPSAALYGSAAANCADDGGTGGFRNSATVTTGLDAPSASEACSSMLAPRLTLSKQLVLPAGPDARVGDTVVYTVTAKNEGDGKFTTVNPAWIIDDLSGVLDDADYDDNATASMAGTLDYASPLLSWNGVLQSGAVVELSYSATVSGGGDLLLRNVAFVGGAACAPGACPTPALLACSGGSCDFTETKVIPPVVPGDDLIRTGGDDIRWLVLPGLLALCLGMAAFGWRRLARRRVG